MSHSMVLVMVGFAGLGTLAFLRLVSNEVAMRIRAMHLRIAAEDEERERVQAKANGASAGAKIHDVSAA